MGKKAKHIFPVLDGLLIVYISLIALSLAIESLDILVMSVIITAVVTLSVMKFKNFYEIEEYKYKDLYRLFECFAISAALCALLTLFTPIVPLVYFGITLSMMASYIMLVFTRVVYLLYRRLIHRTKNVLIVGAGQDGKLIAEEIQQRPELGLKVVGFLDDNMNNIEDEDSTIPILGLTCDSDAVIKDNNVKLVIIAVKSRMGAEILTDLVRGIPLGVKVWRMYRFYEKITKKFLVSKMSVNWLFYDCVRKTAILYAYLKRLCDIVASLAIIILTLPISIIAALGIKLSDFGPIFYTQIRTGKLGKPFEMIKFRSMYHNAVTEDYDDDLTDIPADDKRIMPFCKLLRKFKIDELPQLLNVLRGDMSLVGPRPVREEVYYENKESIPFWECRNWVHPGWCGWQQLSLNEPSAEERLGYDLYYIKHRHLLWEMSIFFRYMGKVIIGKARGK